MTNNTTTANLRNENLRGADLQGANLEGVDLQGADLRGAYLQGAILEAAGLQEADLRDANLRGANLEGSDLRGARLEGACLEGVRLGKDGVRLSDRGVWTAMPPRCEAGAWFAIVAAPGVVRIGCTEMTVDEWLGDEGVRLATKHSVDDEDQATLRQWLLRIDARTDWPGWVPDYDERW